MDWLRSRIGRSPKRVLVAGKALFLAGAILILGAVFARAGLLSINGERTEAGLPALQTLAEAFPRYATWIVPEGPVGYTISALLVLVGMALTVLAEKAMPST
jgi:hypothetical protein